MLWNEQEIKFINSYMSEAYEADDDGDFIQDLNQGIIFDGYYVKKINDNLCRIMNWDYERHDYSMNEYCFEGTLKDCLDYVLSE